MNSTTHRAPTIDENTPNASPFDRTRISPIQVY